MNIKIDTPLVDFYMIFEISAGLLCELLNSGNNTIKDAIIYLVRKRNRGFKVNLYYYEFLDFLDTNRNILRPLPIEKLYNLTVNQVIGIIREYDSYNKSIETFERLFEQPQTDITVEEEYVCPLRHDYVNFLAKNVEAVEKYKKYYLENKTYPMFYLSEEYLCNTSLENKIWSFINSTENGGNVYIKLVENKFNISSHKTLSLYNKVIASEFTIFKYKEDWNKYFDTISGDIITYNDNEIAEILKKEGCTINTKLALAIICIISDYNYIPEITFTRKKSHSKHMMTKRYLVKNELYKSFDFAKFRFELEDYINEKRSKPEIFDLREFVLCSTCWKNPSFDLIDRIKEATEIIAFHEFGLYENYEERIELEANVKPSIKETIENVLTTANTPLGVNTILDEIKKTYNFKLNKHQVQYLIKKDKNIILLGKGLWGLKTWNCNAYGSIRQIVYDFLKNNNNPQSIYSIVHEVNKYYPNSSFNSIKISISSDKKRFKNLSNNYFGLAEEHYSSIVADFIKKDNQKIINEIKVFTEEHLRLPYSGSNTKSEIELASLWKKILHDNTNTEEILELSVLPKGKHPYMLEMLYSDLIKHILENKSIPISGHIWGVWNRLSLEANGNAPDQYIVLLRNKLNKILSNAKE